MLEPTAPRLNPTPSIFTSVTIHFDHMTWGDLRRFVALADTRVGDDEDVCVEFDDSDLCDPCPEAIGLTFVTRDGGQ